MSANRKSMGQGWIDPDDAPDLSTQKWRKKFAAAPVKRGRPKAAITKVSTTIRLDADVLKVLKKSGSGWQTRVNGILRAKLLARSKEVKRA
ncbi:MAG: BrnA antitoxin family protein [Aestuariivirga sp.]